MGNKITDDIYNKVRTFIKKYDMIAKDDVVLAGVSGGADSVCLLLILAKLSGEIGFDLKVVHVHHGMREDADKDAAYVEELCKKLGVAFFLKKVDMPGYAKENGLSLEEAGRKLRYRAFEEALDKQNEDKYKIAVAHNCNDKAETFLFNLFRGSGLKGLGSIRPVRDNIIRPLLCLERSEIEAYLEQEKTGFCIDKTNDDDTYTRNKIRHHILAYANEQICQNATVHISDAADVLAQTQVFVQKQADLAYGRCVKGSGQDKRLEIDLKVFRKEEEFLQKLILLHCMEALTPYRKDITKEHITALHNISFKEGSKELSLPYGLAARKEYDTLVIFKPRKENDKRSPEHEEYPQIQISAPCRVRAGDMGIFSFRYMDREEFFYKKGQIIPEKTYTKWFDCDKITRALVLRTRKTGDFLTIDSGFRKKSIKEYMINEKIPVSKRENLYLLADGMHILWVPGYRISQYYKVDENTKHILQVCLEEDENG